MAEAQRVNAVGLRNAGPGFVSLSSSVAEALRRLASRLDAEGSCWGTDEMGVTFAQSYAPAAKQVKDAFPVLRDGITEVRAAVLVVADDVDAADKRALSRLS